MKQQLIFFALWLVQAAFNYKILQRTIGKKVLLYLQQVGYKNSKMNEFSLKYLAKFVFEHKVERLAINGGFMPLHYIKTNQLTQLLLKGAQLHSEDLFILS